MTPIEVRPVRSAADWNAFIQAAHNAHADDARWAAPLTAEFRRAFSPGSPLLAGIDTEFFTAYRCGVPVGRIAALINRGHLERHRDGAGHFGFIEGIDDQQVFAVLVSSACEWLRARGMTQVRGPFSATINHEAGLLVHGFDRAPTTRTNQARPYYALHLETLGFRKAMDLVALSICPRETDFPERVRATMRRSGLGRSLQTGGLSYLRWHSGVRTVLGLFNNAWSENWGAIPVRDVEANAVSRMLLPVVKPNWIRVAKWRGEPVAIVVQIPNLDEVAATLRGRLLPTGWARILWGVHGRGTRTTRLPMAGVMRRWRSTKVGAAALCLLLAEAIEQARAAAVDEIEFSWILETNRAALNTAAEVGARPSKTFRIYEREL